MSYGILHFFAEQPAKLVLAVCLALLTPIGLLDFVTGYELGFSIFYLIPVALISWCLGPTAGRWFSLFSSVVWLIADRASGHQYSQAWIPLWNALIRFGFFAIIASILPELRAKIERETQEARVDFLTGLPNARAFYELVESRLENNQESAAPLTLAYIEADGLKWINERYGRLAGDHMLSAIADTLQASVPSGSLIARSAGSLFALLLPETGGGAAKTILEELQAKLRDQTHRKYKRPVRFAVAGCTFTQPPRNLGEVMREAERLMSRLSDKTLDKVDLRVSASA